jgi:hypothetical protein
MIELQLLKYLRESTLSFNIAYSCNEGVESELDETDVESIQHVEY